MRALFALAVLFFACAGLTQPAAGNDEIYRCVEGDRVIYTDRGCATPGRLIEMGGARLVAATTREAALVQASASPVAVGMSPRLVFNALGRPVETVATLEGRQLVEYWVYRNIDGGMRVAFEEGRVTRIQSR